MYYLPLSHSILLENVFLYEVGASGEGCALPINQGIIVNGWGIGM